MSHTTVGAILGLAAALAFPASAQVPNDCGQPGSNADIIAGEILDTISWGTVGDVAGFSIGTVACNVGNAWTNG